jgi:predicted  nucleic acid-binding Zn-ribbon protein
MTTPTADAYPDEVLDAYRNEVTRLHGRIAAMEKLSYAHLDRAEAAEAKLAAIRARCEVEQRRLDRAQQALNSSRPSDEPTPFEAIIALVDGDDA